MTTYRYESTSQHACCRSVDTDYETARAGSSVVVESTTTLHVGQATRGDIGYFYCYEAFVAFGTTYAEADGITEPYVANIQLVAVNDMPTETFTLEARLYDWGPTISAADWVAGDDLAALPLMGTWESSDWVAWPDRNVFTSFVGNLNLSGETKMILVGKGLTDGDAPAMVPDVLTHEIASFRTTSTGAGVGSPAPELLISIVDLGGWGVGMVRMNSGS